MSEQYQRDVLLVVSNLIQGLDLSQLQFKFEVNQSDFETPNYVVITIYNLSDTTSLEVQSQYTTVTLGAGYKPDGQGTLFKGAIKQVRRGRINATDTYTEILAADDLSYNFSFMSDSVAGGSTVQARMAKILAGFAENGVNSVYAPGIKIGPALTRGKVLYGMCRDYARDLAQTIDATWSISEGKLVFSSQNSYLPGEVVVLTSNTGMIGLPEQTDNGVWVRCLLNPKIKAGQALRIDNKSIQSALISPLGLIQSPFNPTAQGAVQTLPNVTGRDGLYKALVVEHHGDTRGNDWYTDVTCLAINPSASFDPVAPYAG